MSKKTKKKVPQRANKKGKLNTIEALNNDGRSKYSEEERRKIAEYYAITGSVKDTAEAFGCHQMTICRWKKAQWWDELQQEIQELQEEKLRSQFNKIAEKANQEALDRLEHGDYVYDAKRGELVRKPVSAADATKVAAISYDKRRLSLNQATRITDTNTDALQKLADKFAEIAKNTEYKKIRQRDSVPGEYEELD